MSGYIYTTYEEMMRSGILYEEVSADPPWHFQDWAGAGPGQLHNRAHGANKHYPTMKFSDICDMKPPCEKNAIMFLWTLGTHYDEASILAKAWGFKIVTKAWTWVKIGNKSNPDKGQGYYVRHASEDCYIAIRGEGVGRPVRFDIDDVIFARRTRLHSQKPIEHFKRIDMLYPHIETRLEMFARRTLPKWDAFGNQIKGERVVNEVGEQQTLF